jgi:DNA-binding transcriptional MerR regulator
VNKAPDAFRTISEVAEELELPQHVLRFWETRFSQIRPMKRGGGRRYYRPDDVDLLRGIRHLLYGEGYTIRGVQRILKDQGTKFVQTVWQAGAPQPVHSPGDLEGGPAAEQRQGEAERSRGLFGLLPSFLGKGGEASDVPVAPAARSVSRGEQGPASASAAPPLFDDGDQPLNERSEQGAHDHLHGTLETLSSSHGGLAPEQVRKLRDTLFELVECRRLLDAALREEA